MVQRGLRRRFDPLVEREARAAPSAVRRRGPARPARRCRRSRSTRRRPATSTTRSPPRSCDDGAVRVWVHIADVCAYVQARLGAGPRGVPARQLASTCPGWWSRCCPRRCPTARARWCPAQDRLAVTVELEFEGAKVRRTRVPPLGHPLRRAARLPAGRRDVRGAERARRRGRAAGGRAQGRRARWPRRARRGARWRSSPSEPEFGFSRDGHVETLLPSEQTESHRLIEFLMIAANEAVAGLLEARKLPALFRVHEPPDPARVQRLLDAAGVARRPHAAGARAPDRRAGGRAGRARPRARRREVRRRGTGAPRSRRSSCARLSRRATRRATSATSACARRATATSRRRSAATRT